MPFGWSIANSLVFKKVRLGLGLDRCRYCFTGAAPIMRDTLDFFLSLDIPLLELYGMSESSGELVRVSSISWHGVSVVVVKGRHCVP